LTPRKTANYKLIYLVFLHKLYYINIMAKQKAIEIADDLWSDIKMQAKAMRPETSRTKWIVNAINEQLSRERSGRKNIRPVEPPGNG
jgi:hypothetical protein